MTVIRGNGVIVAGRNIVINGNGCPGLVCVNGIVGNGKVKAERRQINMIDSIVLDGSAGLAFTCGGNRFLRVTANENLLPLVTTNVIDSTLHVGCSGSFTTKNEILVEVEMPSLVALAVYGSGNIEIEKIKQPALHVTFAGSGKINISGKVDQFTADFN